LDKGEKEMREKGETGGLRKIGELLQCTKRWVGGMLALGGTIRLIYSSGGGEPNRNGESSEGKEKKRLQHQSN